MKETIVDLSKEKVELANQIAAKDKVEARAQRLICDLKQIRANTNPRRVARLENRLKMQKDAARSNKYIHDRLLELKAVRSAAMVQKCHHQRAVRNAQKKKRSS